MDLRSLAQWVPGIHFLSELKAQGRCVLPGHPDSDSDSLLLKQNGERVSVGCYGGLGHTTDAILTAWGLTRSDLLVSRPPPSNHPENATAVPAAAFSGVTVPAQPTNGPVALNGGSNGHPKPRDFGKWQLELGYVIKGALDAVPQNSRALIASNPQERLVELVVKQAHELIEEHDSKVWPLPADLSETDIDEELHRLAGQAVTVFQNAYLPATVDQEQEVLICESAEQAVVSNAEYLSRPAIIERLHYTHHISLGVGGKHEGKTTATRTEALAVSMGRPVYGRNTSQTPVIYAASDDEYPTTRMELLRMGWRSDVPLTLVQVRRDEASDPDRVLRALAKLAREKGAHFLVLDMLFDFIRVQDEIKYAHTREAIGYIQNLADSIEGHVKATHHTPKWMPDAATAAKAALGSQGIAARFSPILLSRMWTDDLYTIESTMTRDPRGLPIPPTCIKRTEDGWAETTEPFKSWMKWKLYSGRILGLFEGEPGKEFTVQAVALDLGINRPEAQNALYQMCQGDDAVLEREKPNRSRGYKYRLKSGGLFGADS